MLAYGYTLLAVFLFALMTLSTSDLQIVCYGVLTMLAILVAVATRDDRP